MKDNELFELCKEGVWNKPEYHAWSSMIQRCRNSKHPQYKNYGGRGIVVHPDFLDFKVFIGHIGWKPTTKHTLDRIDVDGNYEPGNIRWLTQKEQTNNMRKNVLITHNNITKTKSEWADELGIKYSTLDLRLRRGWSIEEALTSKLRRTPHYG